MSVGTDASSASCLGGTWSRTRHGTKGGYVCAQVVLTDGSPYATNSLYEMFDIITSASLIPIL